MTKKGLITKLAADYPGLPYRDVEKVLASVIGEIAGALERGDRIEIRGFGVFTPKKRRGRLGRDPSTGGKVVVHEKTAALFKAGKVLQGRLNWESS